MFRLLLLAAACCVAVNGLASKGSFTRRFSSCVHPNADNSFQFRNNDQGMVFGMTMNSFIDTVEKFEKRVFGTQATAQKTALTFLHWFSFPDYKWVSSGLSFEQRGTYQDRYNIITHLFEDELAEISRYDYDELFRNPQDDDHDELCFMMRALSHTINVTCPVNGFSRLVGIQDTRPENPYNPSRDAVRRPIDNQDRNRGRQSNNNNRQQNYPQGAVGAVPNIRDDQVKLMHGSDVQGKRCIFREEGVVSISGRQKEAISVSSVLLGIAASKMPDNVKTLFSRSSSELSAIDESQIPMNPLIMATLGQEIGLAAVISKVEGMRTTEGGSARSTFGIKGYWNQTGCLNSFELDNKAGLPVSLTHAQLIGAVDGIYLGQALRDEVVGSDITLANLLRVYYSNHNVNLGTAQTRLSVCNRETSLSKIENAEVEQQSRLMAYGLLLTSGIGSPDGQVIRFDDKDTNDAVQSVGYADKIRDQDSVRYICPTTNREQCATPADVFVMLDSSVNTDLYLLQQQADILGRIVNGLDFRTNRNVIRVYAGKSGSALLQVPNVRSGNFGASGCAACIAQNLPRYSRNSFPEGERELFMALNETLKQVYNQDRQVQLATAGRVVLFFRMSQDPLKDKDGASEALIRFRIANPTVRIIAIGDRDSLKQLYDHTGAILYYDADLLQQELRSPTNDPSRSLFDEIQQSICETGIDLKNDCSRNGNALQSDTSLRNVRDRNGASIFNGGVNPRQVQYFKYDPIYFSESRDMRVKFTAGTKGHIKVCEAQSGYEYLTGNNQISNAQDTANNDNNNVDTVQRTTVCQYTSDRLKSVYFNYSRPCYYGPRSCATLKYAVVGLTPDNRYRATNKDCKYTFCESVFSIPFTVEAEGMVCGSSPPGAISSLLFVVAAVFFARNFA